MARINNDAFKQYQKGEIVTADEFNKLTRTTTVSVNDIEDKLDVKIGEVSNINQINKAQDDQLTVLNERTLRQEESMQIVREESQFRHELGQLRDNQQDTRLKSSDSRINNMEEQVALVRDTTTNHMELHNSRDTLQDSRLDGLEKRNNIQDISINGFRDRLTTVEDIVEGLQDSVIGGNFPTGSVEDRHLSNAPGQIKQRVATVEPKVTALETKTTTHDTEIEDLKAKDSDLETRVSAFETGREVIAKASSATPLTVYRDNNTSNCSIKYQTTDKERFLGLDNGGNLRFGNSADQTTNGKIVLVEGADQNTGNVRGGNGTTSSFTLVEARSQLRTLDFISIRREDKGKDMWLHFDDYGNLVFQNRSLTSWVDNPIVISTSTSGAVTFNRILNPSWNGGFSVGTASNRWGSIWSVNGAIQTSDERYKSDIVDIDDNILFNMVKGTSVNTYVLNDEMVDKDGVKPLTLEEAEQERKHLGIIAQELAKHEGSEYILNYDEETGYSVNNYNLTCMVMGALKVEIEKREALEKELDLIKAHLGL